MYTFPKMTDTEVDAFIVHLDESYPKLFTQPKEHTMIKGKAYTERKGSWQVSVDGDCRDDFWSGIEHLPSGCTASLSAMEHTGEVDDGWDKNTKVVPEKIQDWALAVEEKYTELNEISND